MSPVPDDPASSRPSEERSALRFAPVVCTRDATLPVLITRIEEAARISPHVQIDLTRDIARYATSAQALDLVLAEQTVLIELNAARSANGLPPIQLSYALSDDPSAGMTPGLADLGTLRVQGHLAFLTPEQRALLDRLARPPTAVGIDATAFAAGDEDAPDMPNEVGEVTLLPIVRLDDTLGSVAPLVQQTRQHLQALVQQGLPGIDA